MIDIYSNLGKIFIAGTGRSGTTIIHNIIGSHPKVYMVPHESKFIVEGDGLNALIPNLHEKYSITASDLALIRFMEMMDARHEASTSEGLRYYEHIGREFYFPALQEFIQQITDFEYNGDPIPCRFDDRRDVIALASRFVGRMFGDPTLHNHKEHWVEKTPSNVIAMDFLWELFPDAVIIHIKRNPLAALESFARQQWFPNDIQQAARLLGHIYWRWTQLKPRLDLTNRRYLEIKLEDLAERPEDIMEQISNLIGISNQFDCSALSFSKIDAWKERMSAQQKQCAEEILHPYFDFMGYPLT
jgi:hypothetical protein